MVIGERAGYRGTETSGWIGEVVSAGRGAFQIVSVFSEKQEARSSAENGMREEIGSLEGKRSEVVI